LELGELSLRPQNDTAAWLQQQEKAAKVAAAAAADQGLNLQGPVHHQMGGNGGAGGGSGGAVPLPILSLMPSFMRSGAPLPATGATAASILAGGSLDSGALPSAPYQNGILGARSASPAVVGSGGFRAATVIPKRPPTSSSPPQSGLGIGGSPTPPQSQQQQANGGGGVGGGRKDKDYVVEPEVAQMQRPIIREEDLERLNAIAKDDSWTKQDDIDYTKKLTFSDDESTPEEHQGQGKQHGSAQQQSQGSSSVLAGNDQRKLSASTTSWQRGKESTEREQPSEVNQDQQQQQQLQQQQQQQQEIRQQNGHRGSSGNVGAPVAGGIALDASVYERVKLRKEEEERREMERKQAAAKKLQELEMKMNSKKAAAAALAGAEAGALSSSGSASLTNDVAPPSAPLGNVSEDEGGGQGGGAGLHRRPRGSISSLGSGVTPTGGAGGGGGAVSASSSAGGDYGQKNFLTHFQSNLPPRFQRQQQQQQQQLPRLEKSASASSAFDSNSRYLQKGGVSGGVGASEHRGSPTHIWQRWP